METEITVQVNEPIEDIFEKLKKKGYKLEESVVMRDKYFSKFTVKKLLSLKYKTVLANSFLIRSFDGEENSAKIVYKNKVIKGDTVLMEEKISTKIGAPEDAEKVFLMAGLTNWCSLVQHMYIFKNDKMEMAVQDVENLGIFIEYEEDESVSGLPVNEKLKKMKENLKDFGFVLGDDYGCKKPFMMLHK